MMFRGNPEHMGDFTSAAGGPMDNFLIKWRNPDPISLFGTSTPAVVDDVVYVGSGTSYPPEGYVYAIDAVEGRLLKTFETRNLVVSSPAVLDAGTQKIVYVGDGDGWVYAFNADTGAKIWEKQKGAAIQSSPVVTVDQGTESEYTVYIGCNDNFVYALDAMTGEERWKFPTRGQIWSSPAVARVGTDTLVFVGSNDNFVYAINDKDGTEAWSFPTGGQVWSSPAVTQIGQDTVVFVGSNDNKVYAIDARTGGNFWNPPFDTGNLVSTSPAIAQVGQDTIVFVGSGSKLYAINAITGIEKWVVTMWTAAGTPSVADGIVYVGGYYYLYGYDAATKSEKVREYTSNWFPRSSSTLVVVDGTIYFGGPDGGLWVRGVHKPLADFTADKTEETTDQYLSVTFTDQSLYNPKSFK
jgi:outer membrane protein assembly factor BamB